MSDLIKQAVMPPPPTIPYGECHCGCGERTNPASKSITKRGIIKGEPQKFLFDHRNRKPRPVSQEIVIDGIAYRTIPLTMDQVAIVDISNYEHLSKHIWCAVASTTQSGYYAARHMQVDGKIVRVYMHREVFGPSDAPEIDHRDGNGLHNWQNNLRTATRAQNRANSGRNIKNSSGFHGVSFSKEKSKYYARLMVSGVTIRLGYFEDPGVAGAAVAAKARELRGEFARS